MTRSRKKYGSSNWGKIILVVLVISVVFGFVFDFAANKVEHAIYPKPQQYAESVQKYSERFNVPEELIWAVIKTESGFDSSAVSSVGAVGLMQLTEATFNEISTQRLKEGLAAGMRYDPDTNIRYGVWYLSYLYGRFENWNTAFAAYNAGPGNVSKWLEDSEYSSDGETLSYIPFKETRNYVKKVNKAIELYDRLYYSE